MASLAMFLLMNGLAFGGAGLLARFGFGFRNRHSLVLSAFLLGWVGIILGLELLGCLGRIQLGPVCLWSCGMFLVGLLCWHLARKSTSPCQVHEHAETEGPVRRWEQIHTAFLVLTSALATWSALDLLISSLMAPVQPVSDAPIYHLYFAIRWWQAGSLEVIPTPFGESAAPYFPANGNLWFTWLILPWSSEFLAKVGQWPFLGVGMVAIWGLARQLPVGQKAAMVPALLWGTATLPLLHSGIADVDLIMAAWYLVGTFFLVRYLQARRPADLAAMALAMGSVLGTKFISILFIPWPVLIAAARAVRGSRPSLHLGMMVLALLLPAGFWYLRNVVLTGNPLYPLHLEIWGIPVLAGWYERSALRVSQYHIPPGDVQSLLQILLRGLDVAVLPVWLAGLVMAFVGGVNRGGVRSGTEGLIGYATQLPRRFRLAPLLVLLGVLHVSLFWVVNPYQTQDRFLFPAFGLLAVPTALVFERWPWMYGPLAGLIGWHLVVGPSPVVGWVRQVCGIDLARPDLPPLMPAPFGTFPSWDVLATNPVWRDRCVLFGAVVVAVGLIWLARGGRSRVWSVCLVVALLSLGIVYRAYGAWIPNAQLRFFPIAPQLGYTAGWLKLDEASGSGCRVAYAGTNLPYYLFARGLRNQVRYVNVNEHSEFRMHDYHRSYSMPLAESATPAWDRAELDESAWLRNLRAHRIDLLFVGLVNRAGGEHNFYDSDGFPVERTWADRNPTVFSMVYGDQGTRLYAVHWGGTK